MFKIWNKKKWENLKKKIVVVEHVLWEALHRNAMQFSFFFFFLILIPWCVKNLAACGELLGASYMPNTLAMNNETKAIHTLQSFIWN